MQVEFLARFSKDLDKINSKTVKQEVIKFIELIDEAKSISSLPNIKKLIGHKNAFRLRIGDYRLGFFVNSDVVQLARIVHRKDIYKVFP